MTEGFGIPFQLRQEGRSPIIRKIKGFFHLPADKFQLERGRGAARQPAHHLGTDFRQRMYDRFPLCNAGIGKEPGERLSGTPFRCTGRPA